MNISTNRSMTLNDFIKIVRAEDDGINNWKGWLKSGELCFQNIYFNNAITFDDDFEYPHNIKLVDCILGDFYVNKGSFNGLLRFENCEIGLFKAQDGIFKNQLIISDCQVQSIYLEGEYVEDVRISSSTIKSTFEIRDCQFHERVDFDNNIFEGLVRIWGGTFKHSFALYYSTFKGELSFQNVSFEREFKIGEDVKFKSDINFQSGTFKSVEIFGGSYRNVIFLGGKFEKLEITGNPEIERIRILFQYDLNIKYLRIDFSKIISKLYLIEGKDGAIQKLHLEGVVAKEVLCEFVSISTPDSISFDNLTNFGNIYFKDVTPAKLIENDNGFFVIKNSDLGKTTFMGSDFSTLYLDFHSSKITESFLSDTIMPYQIKTFIKKEGTVTIKDNPEQQRLGYGQLKKVYENRGDGVTALSYYSKEMNALMISPNIGFGERINLFLGRISNNHGTDWVLGLISTFVCGGICFFFFCFHFNIKPSLTEQGWGFFWNNSMPAFLEFFNPLHKTKEIAAILKNIKPDEVKLNWDNSLVDFVSKIFITYFEYQLIQAFRKYGKK
jgi:hypothetical protein